MAAPASIPILHRFLGLGLIVLIVVFGAVNLAGSPVLAGDDSAFAIAAVLTGLAIVAAAIALLILKPRVQQRSADQPLDKYWSRPDVAQGVLPVWFLLEGAAVLSAVGWFLTGEALSAVATGVMTAVYWLCGPKVFAR